MRTGAEFPFILALVVLSSACSPNGGSASDGGDGKYKTAVAEIGDVRDIVPAVGTLEAVGQVEVRAAATGTVATILVKPNDTVTNGQILAELRDPNDAADVRAARAAADSAKAHVDEASAGMKQIAADLAAQEELARSGVKSAASLEKLKLQLQQAKASLERAEADARNAEAQHDLAVAKSKLYAITAPREGVVIGINLRVGQTVAPADKESAFLIGNTLDKMQVTALISESDVRRVQPDMKVFVKADAYPDAPFRASLERLEHAPVKNGRFVSYPAVISVENFGNRLFSGMTAAVELVRANARSVLRIPVAAIYYAPPDYTPELPPELLARLKARDRPITQNTLVNAEAGWIFSKGLNLVFVLQDGHWLRREIKIGGETDEYVEVTEGLSPGDVVITGDTKPQM